MGYLKEERDPLWWPNSGTFEVVVGAILTQQTKWEKVEKALENLKARDLLSLEAIARTDLRELAALIKPSGFYNTKAKRLRTLCRNILERFGAFETFAVEVEREWLLAQKGVGEESADSILCYGCNREVFVMDSYTARILDAFGYTFESYAQMQAWMEEGVRSHKAKIDALYEKPQDLNRLYARFHGKIVEFAKEHIRGRYLSIEELEDAIDG